MVFSGCYKVAIAAQKKRLKWLYMPFETLKNAERGTRTPMPLRAQRPERCVSTNFTTSAGWLVVCAVLSISGLFRWTCIILLYSLRPVKGICGLFVSFFVKILVHVPWLIARTCYNMFALFLLCLSFLWAIFLSARRLEGYVLFDAVLFGEI